MKLNQELRHVLTWMLIFLGAVLIVCALLASSLWQAFLSNPIFNAMILLVLVAGIVVNLRQVLVLNPEINWIESLRSDREPPQHRLRLVAPLATMLGGFQREGVRLSVVSMRSVLEGIRLRLDESRDISRYMTGLLIFLGLLGTFWGLLDTVSGVTGVISGISAESGAGSTFSLLKDQLAEPLSGMATAFSSSLFGLGGALILGFVDIQAGHAQNRFYNHLEEWLSELTHLPSRAFGGEGLSTMPSHIEAMLEQTADSLHKMQRVISQSEGERRAAQKNTTDLTDVVGQLADQLRSVQKVMINLAKSQMDAKPGVQPTDAEKPEVPMWSAEEEMRDSVRNIEQSLVRFREEIAGGREYLLAELRKQLDSMRVPSTAKERVRATVPATEKSAADAKTPAVPVAEHPIVKKKVRRTSKKAAAKTTDADE